MSTLLQKLDLKIPIIQAPMAGTSTPAMAAAVCNSGALGSIAIGAATPAQARSMINETRALTSRVFNVNVFCHREPHHDQGRETKWLTALEPYFKKMGASPPPALHSIYKSFTVDDEMLRLLLELAPGVVSFHFGLSDRDCIEQLRRAGTVLLATATSLDEAKLIAEAGIDAVVAQGYEAGGHRGIFADDARDDRLTTAALTRILVSNLSIPVIAAGGIMDGAGIKACLALGAQAAQLGTAFIGCPESAADDYYRRALFSPAAFHTVMTRVISGRPARCLANDFTALGEDRNVPDVPDYPIAYHAGKELNAAARKAGEGGYGAQWAGQGAPLARALPAADLIARLQAEMAAAD
ncbi:MAG: nitronate monooxygenase [Cyanobacteria bacterium SZAS LIN-2]|nr:nitronate monooxygenase [Cyanobacteria bacterium SZAS LIN-2]